MITQFESMHLKMTYSILQAAFILFLFGGRIVQNVPSSEKQQQESQSFVKGDVSVSWVALLVFSFQICQLNLEKP